ncbi:hypothetical protein [Cohaesibacter sp. CAU 1516]|uniref:hypothetical protein n=1 Tax=Cohaesibacter sp. CAU 1516 TaxID=2576038 RepID=UPI001FF06FE2|nr:hypothetical protein [Cohaesibacter sp. CAU 1516]
MDLFGDVARETGVAPTTDPASSGGFRYRDALRLLFILVVGSDDAAEPTEECVKVFSAEKRLMAMDFLVRYPDYLADALLDVVETEGDVELLEKVVGIFDADEPSVRLVRMVRWKRGAYENIEDALSLLSYYGLVRSMQLKGEDGKVRRYEYQISSKAVAFLDKCVTDHPRLVWYRERMMLVMRVASNKSGSKLKDWQYEHPTYGQTLHGDLIPSIRGEVEKRLRRISEKLK